MPVDPLAQIVALLRPHTVLSKMVRGGGRWAIAYPAFEQPSFALVLQGPCWLVVEGKTSTALSTGDFVLFPATPGFTLASEPDVDPVPMAVASSSPDPLDVVHGDSAVAPSVSLLGGWFAFDAVNLPLLVDLLPRMLHIVATDPAIGDVAAIVDLIRRETAASKPGGALILKRLAEILLVEAIRSSPPDDATAGLLAGLRDPRLARALGLIHAEPAGAWNLDSMALAAGMSRSSFAESFCLIVGRPPLAYLLRWRMAVARNSLANEGGSVAKVALAVGYQSASAFSTAFSRVVGQPPRAFIRNPRRASLARRLS